MHIPVAVCKMRKLQIQVLTRDGRKNIYETDRSRNVADLKKRIGRSMNVPMAFSRLTYKGRLLTNDSILEDEGVKRMSTLELYWQPLVLTPKQYREKELELDKLDQKQRHVSRIAENYEQTVKKGGHERTPSGLRRTRDHLRVKRSLSADDMKLSTNSFIRQPERKIEECVQEEEQSSTSSDELDFLAAYWCCSKSTVKKNRKSTDPNVLKYADVDVDADDDIDVDVDADLRADAKQLDANSDLKSTVSGIAFPCNKNSSNNSKNSKKNNNNNLPKDDDLLEDLQRCLSCKHQPFRNGLRLAAGRMSRSIISNIRKNQKNCKK
ncbi:uncharacterized protein [Drosophila virilis]|uniref:Ubiquitin-like domain-containing protein n=1 Tax=Drosophila virilis TaxID=7244 RepID=B4M2M5_DROVI|nr:uncharacterized protein LOC6631867 [Drosophila virilis]EDW65929.2 uncharacterized protein Dvir_GJ18624 [Drosophila virilis]